MTAMCTAIANYLIEKTDEYNGNPSGAKRILLSCKRLQKLLYFSDILYMLKNNGESMFEDDFYAWSSGPVIPSIYDKFKKYQNGVMVPIDIENHTSPCPKTTCVLDQVFTNTIDISTLELIERSHVAGGPWEQVYNADDELHLQKISKKAMYEFYKEHPEEWEFLKAS